MPDPVTYFEDTAVGETRATPAMTVTAMHVTLFSSLAGDPPAASDAVPDLLPICLSTGLGWRVDRPPLAVLAFMGFEWQFVRPLRVGDTIHATSRTAVRRAIREGGVIVEDHQIVDQRGEVVQRGRFTFLLARRPGTTPAKEDTP
jgi:acyl dehydratase